LKEQLKAFIRLGAKSEILVLITSAWFTSAAAGHSLAYVRSSSLPANSHKHKHAISMLVLVLALRFQALKGLHNVTSDTLLIVIAHSQHAVL